MDRIYLDYAATTPLSETARQAMLPWLTAEHGNPSSLHAEGRGARLAVDDAREAVSKALSCEFGEVVFTSSGTEAANLAVVGAALANQDPRRNRILFNAAEHHCVLHTEPMLRRLGYFVEVVRVDRWSRPDLDHLHELLAEDVLLVSAMHANNETGAITLDLSSIRTATSRVGALWHCDAVQTLGHIPCDEVWDADLVTVSAHKLYGPKGAGALRIRAGTRVAPLTFGGGQEREMRAGTENVAAIVGFAAACTVWHGLPAHAAVFRQEVSQRIPNVVWTLPPEVPSLPGHAHLRVPGCSAESLLIVLDRLGVSASSGAACSSGAIEPSHVLLAMGLSKAEASEGLRFTFGRSNCLDQAAEAAARLARAVSQVSGG